MSITYRKQISSDTNIIARCGDKGALWAAEFCGRNPAIDEGTMIAWFANAIEAACDVRKERWRASERSRTMKLCDKLWEFFRA